MAVIREGNIKYLNFLEFVFEKNQSSAVPVTREQFFNVAQQFWHELALEMETKGADQIFDDFRPAYGRGRRTYGKERNKQI